MPVSPTAVFPVSAGSHTIYLVGRVSGTSDSVVWDAQLNLLFIPTSYGTVALAEANDDGRQGDNTRVSPAVSAADLSAERSQSISVNDQRVADELAAMRAQLDALQATVNSQQSNGGDQTNR